jgi:hypothetical protein
MLCPRWQRARQMVKCVPGDLGLPSLIGWVSEYQEQAGVLKQESRGQDRTWIELATTRCFYGGGNIDWGQWEIHGLWRTIGGKRGCYGWVITLRSSQCAQFITSLRGGRGFGRRRAAVRETGSHWHAWLVSFVVANSPAMNRHRKPSYCDVVKRVIVWHDRGKRRCPR